MIWVQPLVGYEQDYNLWIEHTVALLKLGQFADLDVEHLIDELESMSKRDKREILSRLKVLLMHLLKWKYQSSHRCGSWEATIRTNRDEIAQLLADSPSLKAYPAAVLEQAYPIARKNAASETGLPLENFPKYSPFEIEGYWQKIFGRMQTRGKLCHPQH